MRQGDNRGTIGYAEKPNGVSVPALETASAEPETAII
jgi:hypothetical protein